MPVTFKQLSAIEWDGAGNGFDFHVRYEDGRFVVDVFRSSITDNAEAHIRSYDADTVSDAMTWCEEQ